MSVLSTPRDNDWYYFRAIKYVAYLRFHKIFLRVEYKKLLLNMCLVMIINYKRILLTPK